MRRKQVDFRKDSLKKLVVKSSVGRSMSHAVIRHPIPQGILEVWNVESQTLDARVHCGRQEKRQFSEQEIATAYNADNNLTMICDFAVTKLVYSPNLDDSKIHIGGLVSGLHRKYNIYFHVGRP
jgi:hypothetical protein